MNEKSTETLSVVIEREIPFPPEKIWRALTQPRLIEEWLMKNDFKPVVGHRFQSSRRLGRCRLSGPGSRAEQNAVLHVDGLWSRECRHLDSHPCEHRDPPAHGAVGLPTGSAAVLPGRQGWMAGVLCCPGAGSGADRLKSAGTIQSQAKAEAEASATSGNIASCVALLYEGPQPFQSGIPLR